MLKHESELGKSNNTSLDSEWSSLGDDMQFSPNATVPQQAKEVSLESYEERGISLDSRVSKELAMNKLDRTLRGHPDYIKTDAMENVRFYPIVAIVTAAGTIPFWIMDMRKNKAFVDAKVPYLVVETIQKRTDADNGYSHTKGVRFDDSLTFGLNFKYGGERFSYDKYISREHFKINCDQNGELSISDLGSTNGTKVLAEFSNEGKKEQRNDWLYTPRLEEFGRGFRGNDGQLYIKGDGVKYPLISRDATRFNGMVDANLSKQADVLIDGYSERIERIYDKLKGRIEARSSRSGLGQKMSLTDKLKQVSSIVDDFLPYNVKARDAWEEKAKKQKELLRLSDYVENGAGVCREQALLSACLMEKLQEDGLLDGEIHVERNATEKNTRHGHEWATFTERGSDDTYVIDVAQHYVGKKKNSPYWNYDRPKDKSAK